jgi:hypothetical protein
MVLVRRRPCLLNSSTSRGRCSNPSSALGCPDGGVAGAPMCTGHSRRTVSTLIAGPRRRRPAGVARAVKYGRCRWLSIPKQWPLARSLSSTSSKVVVVPLRRSAVPLFKTNLKTAWAEGKRSAEAEIERVMPTQSAAHLAAPLMQAFGSDGPKRGKSLTQHDLVKWILSQYEFSSRALKALAYQKIDAAYAKPYRSWNMRNLSTSPSTATDPTNGPPPVLDWRHWPAVKTLSGSTSQSGRVPRRRPSRLPSACRSWTTYSPPVSSRRPSTTRSAVRSSTKSEPRPR